MELLASLNLSATTSFFTAFFALPTFYWRGFLASKLSPTDLVGFALVTFLVAGNATDIDRYINMFFLYFHHFP